MPNELTSLLNQAMIYGAINLGVRLVIGRSIVSAALAFWVGWVFLLTSGLVVVAEGWRSIGTQSAPYIELLFEGAFIGFLVGTFFGAPANLQSRYVAFVALCGEFFEIYGRKVLAALFILGSVFLVERLATVGLSSNYLTEVRSVYNQREGSVLLRIGSHLSVLLTTFIILRGVYDSYHGVNIRMLVLVVLAGAPLGLANGGRAFLLSYTIAYLASILLCRANFSRMPFALSIRELCEIAGLVAVSLTIFAIMGFVRGGYGAQLDILYAVLIWPVSTLYAMDSWVFAALAHERTYGLNTFGWVLDVLYRLQVIDISEWSATVRDVVTHFRFTNNPAAVIPRSILPDLIFDFGPGMVLFSMAIIAFLLEVVSSSFAGRGIFLHVLAVQCLLSSFTTIQNSVISPGFAVSIFWAAVLAFLARNYEWTR